MTPRRERVGPSLLRGLFGGLFAVAIVGVLLAFVALRESGGAGLVAIAVTFAVGFAVGFAYEWRRERADVAA